MAKAPHRMLGIVSIKKDCEDFGLSSDLVAQAIEELGVDIDRSTSNSLPSTTLEESGSGLRYRVVDGLKLNRSLPLVVSFYRSVLLDIVRSLTGEDLVPQADLRGALSLNAIPGGGGRYERHVDDSSFTSVLYFETRTIAEGCSLDFEDAQPLGKLRIFPVEYLLAVFTGQTWTHAVSPNLSPKSRCCLVANYWLTGVSQDRPEDLDDYLYGSDAAADPAPPSNPSTIA